MLAVAVALDAALPEPPNAIHPVAWIGKGVSFLERIAPMSGRAAPLAAGVGIAVAVPVLAAAAFGWAGVGLHEAGALAYVLVGGMLLKTTFTVRGLRTAAISTAGRLASGDLAAARRDAAGLVGRDTTSLDIPLIAGATVESVAENTTDSYVAPWLAFALLGLPGAIAYRAVNTLDSMIGYRGRYEYIGKAAARLDDAVNLAPARISAMLHLAAGAVLRLPVAQAWSVLRHDRGRTASPNAGWTMSAMAGLLGIRLVKEGHYRLGEDFRDPQPNDVRRAVKVCLTVAVLALALTVGLLAARHTLVG